MDATMKLEREIRKKERYFVNKSTSCNEAIKMFYFVKNMIPTLLLVVD